MKIWNLEQIYDNIFVFVSWVQSNLGVLPHLNVLHFSCVSRSLCKEKSKNCIGGESRKRFGFYFPGKVRVNTAELRKNKDGWYTMGAVLLARPKILARSTFGTDLNGLESSF